MTTTEFILRYKDDAIEAMKQTGIPASVTLAQGGLESAWGAAVFDYNFFGIKANKAWTGAKQLLRTTEILKFPSVEAAAAVGISFPEVISIEVYGNGYLWHVRDWFRSYDSVRDGFIDHANFFKENGRYNKALLDEGDAIKFAQYIATAGYSTTPNYGQVLANIITQNNLKQYDLC